MLNLLKNLRGHTRAIAAIVALLIVQAYCDLALPQYTSGIVDVGIQQGGIENAAPDRIRGESLRDLQLFMSAEEAAAVDSAYHAEGELFVLAGSADVAALNEIFAGPMAAVSTLAESEEASMDRLKVMLAAGEITQEELVRQKEEILAGLSGFDGSMVQQRALLYVRQEYEAMGMDMGRIQTDYLLRTGGKMLGLTIVMMTAAIVVGYLASRTAAGIGMDLRGRVFDKVVAFSNEEINQFSTASLITRSTNDIQQVQMVTVMLLRVVSYAPILGIGGIIKVAGTRTGMGWIIGVAVGAILLLVSTLMSLAMPRFKKMQTLVDRLNLVSREILTGIPVIRAFSREPYEEKRFDGANRDLYTTQLFTNRVMAFMMPVMMLIMNGVTVLIVWNGARNIDLGILQVGDMIAFISYTMQIVMSFLMLTMISVMLPRAGVAADRINEVLETKAVVLDRESPTPIRDSKGVVAFENVSFHYPGADEDALRGVSFTAEPGKTTAIIGSTGSGKSTLVQLIPRFYDVTGGRVTLDGVDVRDLSQKDLRAQLGYVPQKALLFSGDIASNLKFGGDWITDEAMISAAEIAQASDFIAGKEQGYHSPISQGGSNVSGGQKQRLSIARAIAKNPKVFLFDDSFSALDYKTDVVLRRALGEKVADATVIIVAQRISTILHADQILVLDEGRIVGQGTHDELMRTSREYMEIARSQLSEKELEGGLGA